MLYEATWRQDVEGKNEKVRGSQRTLLVIFGRETPQSLFTVHSLFRRHDGWTIMMKLRRCSFDYSQQKKGEECKSLRKRTAQDTTAR